MLRCAVPDNEANGTDAAGEVSKMVKVGDVIGGRYRVERPLGEGGMAVVYQATDTLDGHAVAIKVLHDHLLADKPDMVARFRLEARLMQRLSHPQPHPSVMHVEQVIAEPKLQALVMPLIPDGFGLDTFIASQQTPLDEGLAVALMGSVLEGLSFIHAHDILHRDLKPSNILLRRTAQGGLWPVLADLGIARDLTTQDDLAAASVDSADALGSPPYMAPELFDSAHEASPASDVYALGATLYEMLAGKPAFVVESVAAHVLKISTQPPPSLRAVRPDIAPWVDQVISVALAQDPAERFLSAADFLTALQTKGDSARGLIDDDPTKITSDYRVNSRIGRGPVATVFDCTDTNLNVPVALKRLRGQDAGRKERFLSEAKAQSALHQGRPHPNVAAIRHVIAQDGCNALVVERVKGEPWDVFCAQANKAETMTLELALSLWVQLADALDYAHQRQVMHRNLKPSNVLVTQSPEGPRVKLTDFGMDVVAGGSRLSAAKRRGLLAYLPPETADQHAVLGVAADLFGAGVLVLEALLGRRPPAVLDADGKVNDGKVSGGAGIGNEKNDKNAAQRAIPHLPSGVEAVLSSCLDTDPQKRPASAEALRNAIQQARLTLTANTLGVVQAPRGQRLLFVALVLGVLTVGGVVAWLLLSEDDAPTTTPAPTVEPPPQTMSDQEYANLISQLQVSHQQDITQGCVMKLLMVKENQATVRALGLKRAETNLQLSISADGKLEQLDITQDDLSAIGMGECIAAQARTWTYPTAGKPMQVAMPWPLDL